ncbi:hypothetical protein BGZ92_004405 [Podila epicladia]|nr:hypothetical protein BGZ92_004405 [Podila epicladia]
MAAVASPMQASSTHRASNVVVFEKTIDVDEDVCDFFNARFSSRDDLTNIKAILKEQESIGQDLNKKFEESKAKTSHILKEAQATSKSALDNLQTLESSAMDLEEQMETSETFASGRSKRDQRSMIEELSNFQNRVQALEDAKTYITIVAQTQKLISTARTLLKTSAKDALVPYNSLVELSKKVKGAVQGNNTKLESFLSASVDSLLHEFKASLSMKFQASLDAIGWPTPIPHPSSIADEKQEDFDYAFKEYLLLQEPVYGPLDRRGKASYPPLLPMELMVAPLILRFRFHFEGKRPTNRLDKPEWYLSHVLGLIKDHAPLLQKYVQTIVQETEYKEYDVKNDFIRLLIGAVERKIRLSVPAMLSTPEILSHAIHETLLFDKVLREDELYIPPGQTIEWQGAVQIYLGNRNWLKTWLRVEKDFAVARYTQIMDDTEAWQPAYEDIGEKDFVIPTKSAEKLMDLLEIVTQRYRPLPVLEHRTFLLDIQLDLLIAYHRHIRGLVDQYESLTYSFVRVMPGTATDEELNTMGVAGLRTLSQWLASTEYISSTLKDWGEDVFFLELYKEISERTQEVKNPMHSDNEATDDEDEPSGKNLDANGMIFDESIRGFDQLSERIQELMVKNVTKEVFGSMKPYLSLRSWPQIEFSAPERNGLHSPTTPIEHAPSHHSPSYEDDAVSPELYQPLSLLTRSFEFLAQGLPTRDFTGLYRQISQEMQDFMWQKVVMKNQFSELGGLQFARDIRIGLFGASRRWVKKPENYHRKLKDACILLSLQRAKVNSPHPVGQAGVDGGYPRRTLAQIMAVIFDDELRPEEIKTRLEEIGVTHLMVSEAKDVIRKRVECWR